MRRNRSRTGANIWQYTQSEYIEGKQFDANLILDFDV